MLNELRKLALLFERKDKLRLIGLLGLMFAGSMLEMVGVGAVPAFIATLAVPEQVLQHETLQPILEWLGVDTGRELVVWGSVGLILVYVFKTAFLAMVYWMQVRIAESYQVRLANRLFSCYMQAPYEFHLARNSAELLRNVNNETKEIISGVVYPLLSGSMSVMMTLLIVGLLVAATPAYALAGIAVVGLGSWLITRVSRKRLQASGQMAQAERRASVKAIQQGLGGVAEARILGVEERFIAAFEKSSSRLRRAMRTKQFISRISSPLLELSAVAGMLLVVLAIALVRTDITSLIPALALFGAAIIRLKGSISSSVTGLSTLRHSIVAIEPVFRDIRLLEAASREKSRLERKAANRNPDRKLPLEKRIAFEGVSYTYPNTSTPVLKDIQLTIEKGSSIAFVGSTGSGKTTLMNVLLGLLKPQEGSITVDGVDIHSDLQGWLANVGYIPQTIYLLDDTLRRNIAFGLSDAEIDETRLWSAIRAAQLESFVLSLKDGLKTVVGERGVRLSGGQRQRVGLARALYHNPEVLIMDEATSALDNVTENLVMQALEELKDGRTIIMIAHRLSTVRNCDRIYFMNGGRIEAAGTYEELAGVHDEFREMAAVA